MGEFYAVACHQLIVICEGHDLLAVVFFGQFVDCYAYHVIKVFHHLKFTLLLYRR